MSFTIKLVSLVGGQPTEHDGRYLREYDPSHTVPGWPDDMQRAGECWLVTTDDPHNAMHFWTFADALREWNRVDEREPVRPDGQANRPLSAFSILIEPLNDP